MSIPARRRGPGTGITIHLAVADLEEGLERVKANGGTVVSPIIAFLPAASPIASTPTAI